MVMSKSLDNSELSRLYEETVTSDYQIINEMTDDVVDYLNDNFEKLPFDSIFGDKLRIVIPIGGDLTARSIISDLKRIKDFSGFDLRKGEVIRKIQIDPKYGGGDKEQKINIGKAVSALKIDPDTKKKYLDWLARYKDNLEDALNDESEYGIIISRAPIDVVRMSDHKNISSCHSRGGSHFYCAVQEAITGGAVAYVVYQETIDNLESDDELQNPEFFLDNDRDIEGFRPPIARLRIRRLESESGKELGVPDDRVYGDSSIPGFHKTLVDFLKRQQSGQIKDYIDDPEKWVSRGGSYFDTRLPKLAEDFIENGEENISHDYDDRSNETNWAVQGWEEELSSTRDMYNRRLDYCKVDYYIDNDEQPCILPSSSCSIDMTQFNLPEDLDFSIDDSYELKKAIKGNQDDDIIWSGLLNYLDGIGLKNINIGTFQIDSNAIEISFYDEDNSILTNPSDYDDYCNYIEKIDNDIQGMIDDPEELIELFKEIGLISDNTNLNRYNDFLENGSDYKSFVLGERNKELYLEYPKNFVKVVPSKNMPRKLKFSTGNGGNIDLILFISNIGKQLFKPISGDDSHQSTFSNLYESYINSMSDIDFTISPINYQVDDGGYHVPYSKIGLMYNREFKLILNDEPTDKVFQFFDFLDDISKHIQNALKIIMLKYIKDNDPEMFQYYSHYNLPQMEKYYNKYFGY